MRPISHAPARRHARRVAARLLVVAAAAALAGAAPAAPRAASQPGFIIVVHPSNPLGQLTYGELRALFLRRTTTFADGRAVAPVDLPPESPVRIAFSRTVLGLPPRAVSTYWLQEVFARRATPPPVRSTVAEAAAFVARDPGGVAYLPANTPLDGVRAVKVLP